MTGISVEIIRFVDNSSPGFVECRFMERQHDSDGCVIASVDTGIWGIESVDGEYHFDVLEQQLVEFDWSKKS